MASSDWPSLSVCLCLCLSSSPLSPYSANSLFLTLSCPSPGTDCMGEVGRGAWILGWRKQLFIQFSGYLKPPPLDSQAFRILYIIYISARGSNNIPGISSLQETNWNWFQLIKKTYYLPINNQYSQTYFQLNLKNCLWNFWWQLSKPYSAPKGGWHSAQ